MILAIDIGNTNIVIAIYAKNTWSQLVRYETKEPQPEFYYSSAIRQIMLEASISPSEISRVVVSSVVPDLNQLIVAAITHATSQIPVLLGPELFMKLDMPVPHPYEIGSDIVANAYGALKTAGNHCLVVDFGTALTFTSVSSTDGISGVTIAPGIKTAMLSLAAQTAMLPVVPVQFPPSALGHDTISAIQAGVMYGYVGLVRELIARIKNEIGQHYITVATGGLSNALATEEDLFDIRNMHLTLDGMRHIAMFASEKKIA